MTDLEVRKRNHRLNQIRNRIWSSICEFMAQNGHPPAAIAASGEFFLALADDRQYSVMKDWHYLWRGIPVISISLQDQVFLIPKAVKLDIQLDAEKKLFEPPTISIETIEERNSYDEC